MPHGVELPPDEPVAADGSKSAGWWHESEDGQTLVCDLCPRACKPKLGARGFCFVRRNSDGRMVSTTYGRSTGFCIDPIEKKPLNHFYPGTAVLSFGTAGCNLGCKFCQNWTSSRSREVDDYCELAQPDAIAEAAHKLNCKSVAFTYNDPIVWAEYAIDTAVECRRLGVKTVAVTSGYISPAARAGFFEKIDAANVDLKAFSEDFYKDLTGGHLQPVLDTLQWLVRESDVWLEITNLIVPGANDSPAEIEQMCDWIADRLGPDVPLHFSAFHPDFKLVDRGPTPPETLAAAHDIAKKAGLRYVYTGNVSDASRQSTYCPSCDRVLIERDGYNLGRYELKGDRCGNCGEPIAGRFGQSVGSWGSRRQAVRIADFVRLSGARPSGNPATAKKETKMESNPSEKPADIDRSSDRPNLDAEQEALIFNTAGRRVAAVVRNLPPRPTDRLPGDAANTPVLGAFVTLKRAGQLRSCCGFLGQSVPLGEALDHAAVRAAKDDPRFPPISPTELEHLDMDVWVLWGMKPVEQRGEDRIKAVTIGKHGLQIIRGGARGLLLPSVALDHNLDAEAFLEAVCRKAALPLDAWKDDNTTLMTFEGHSIEGRLESTCVEEEEQDVPPTDELTAGGPTRAELDTLVDFCRENLIALLRGATPNSYLPGGFDDGVCGLTLRVHVAGSAEQVECNRLAPRPEMPLQSTLFRLMQAAADVLRAQRVDARALQTAEIGLSVLWDPAMHGTLDEPELDGVDPATRAVMVGDAARWAWIFDPSRSAEELLAQAAEVAVGEASYKRATTRVISLAIATTEPEASANNAPRVEAVRPAAVAGGFYPGEPGQLARAIDEFLPSQPEPERWAGAMVPHAGWTYSGRLAAEVLSRVEIPDRTIIFCPRHRPGGAAWAVAPHKTWSLPGANVESDPDLARQLAGAVSGLELDSAAHRAEHAIEVQLPIIARLAPHTKVVGVAIGGGDFDALAKAAEQLAGLLGEMSKLPLLVISTDMNHFADDETTRRLDRLALDAVESLDPARLYQTVTNNRISMCGMLPAVLVMETLRRLDLLTECRPVGYATSAEVSGDTQRVVGYAGMLFR